MIDLRVFGNCSLTGEAIQDLVRSGRYQDLMKVPGEFVVAANLPYGRTELISSFNGISPHYYSAHGGVLSHGTTVQEVMTQSHQDFVPDWEALGDLFTIGHTTGDKTLHAGVKRVPPASVVSFADGKLNIQSIPWDDKMRGERTSPQDLLDLFNGVVARIATPESIVSMSAGLDSRLILSAMLRQGFEPSLLTMGFDNSTDVMSSREAAQRFNLPFTRVPLEFSNYIDQAEHIASLTSGVKSAFNWHTYLYTQDLKDQKPPLFVGTNGEFVRSFMLGEGRVSLLGIPANILSRKALEVYWSNKLKRLFTDEEIRGLAPGLAETLSPDGMLDRRDRMIKLCEINGRPRLLAGLDRFYLEQRVRHFQGNGIALLSEHVQPMTPMLDPEWCRAAWNLPRNQKVGAAWHRFAIQNNEPDLMSLSAPGDVWSTSPRPPIAKMIANKHRGAEVGYAHYGSWSRSEEEVAFLEERLDNLSWLIEPKAAADLVGRHVDDGSRERIISTLHALAGWRV